jgi:hypothetical protein
MHNRNEPGRQSRRAGFTVAFQPSEIISGQVRANFGKYVVNVIVIADRPPDRSNDQPSIARDEISPCAFLVACRERRAPRLRGSLP